MTKALEAEIGNEKIKDAADVCFVYTSIITSTTHNHPPKEMKNN